MKEPESLEIFRILKPLSIVFVEMERSLKEEPDLSLREFCERQSMLPLGLLYSNGFSGLLSMSALIPIKEALEKSQNDQFKETELRTARNALCHGTIYFLDNGKIRFEDREKNVELSATEIINLASDAYVAYTTKLAV